MRRFTAAAFAFAAAALVAAAVVPSARAVEDGSFNEDIYSVLSGARACVRLLNLDGNVGCATSSDGAEGTIYAVADAAAFAADPPSGDLAVYMPAEVFGAAAVNALRDSDASVAGVMVGYKEKPDGPHSPAALTDFNPEGDGMLFERYPFAIVYLTAAETAVVEAAAARNAAWDSNGEFLAYRADFRYPMQAKTNTRDCFADNTCLPMGGHSVWGVVGGEIDGAADYVMAVTGLDAAAMFQDAVTGVEAAVSGTVALLAAFDALASEPTAAALATKIVFAFFQGEAWDHVGSRRFFSDVESFNCTDVNDNDATVCNDPPAFDLAFEGLRPMTGASGRLQSVLEVQQVYLDPRSGPEAGDRQFYIHGDTGSTAAAAVTAVAADISGVSVQATTAAALPPSSTAAVSAERVLIAGFDTPFNNRLHHSRFDNPKAQTATQWVSRVTGASTLLARSLYRLAGGPAIIPETLRANEDEVTRLVRVLTGEEQVDGFAGLGNHYSSVFQFAPASAVGGVPAFVRKYMEDRGAANGTHYHEAYDPNIFLSGRSPVRFAVNDSLTLVEAPVWAESSWPDRFRARVFRAEDPVVSWTMLGVGLTLAVGGYIAAPFLQEWAAGQWKMV